jgi:hypothetical protein
LPNLFDDFNAKRIDPGRWKVASTGADPNDALTRMAELSVEQTSGRLKMEIHSYGLDGGPGSGSGNQGQVWLNMAQGPANVARGVQVTARVEESETTGCIASSTSRTAVSLNADLFRSGPNPYTYNNAENVVGVMFDIVSRPTFPKNTVRIVYGVYMCTTPTCSDELRFGDGNFAAATVGEDITLGIELDTINNRVILTKSNEQIQSVSYPETLIETFPPASGPMGKGIWIRQRLDMCPTPAEAKLKVTFDNFRTAP